MGPGAINHGHTTKSCFWGTYQRGIIVIYRFWAQYSPPTTSGELFRPFGPSLSSQLFLGSDLGPKSSFYGRL